MATENEASYIDYEAFASPDFHAPSFANTLVLSTNDPSDTSLDLSTPLSRVLFDVQEVDTHIDSLTTSSALALLEHTSTRANSSNRILETVESQVQGLQQAYKRLEVDVTERYEAAEQVRVAAERMAMTLRLARSVARCLQLGRSLETSMAEVQGKKDGFRALVPAATTILSLRQATNADDEQGKLLSRVNAINTLKTDLVDPAERDLLNRSQQAIREFTMSTLANTTATSNLFSNTRAEDTRQRTIAALQTLYLLSIIPTSPSMLQYWPNHLLLALKSYLQTSLTSSSTSLARALATLPTLDRTLLDISFRCQNLVALEALLSTSKPPPHPDLPDSVPPPPTFLSPLLNALDTTSLPSYFWRSLASSMSPKVQEIIQRGGVSARTLRSNKDRVRDAVRECVHRGSQLPSAAASRGKANVVVGNWEREAAVMVGSIVGVLGR